jgi:hypothetical protein
LNPLLSLDEEQLKRFNSLCHQRPLQLPTDNQGTVKEFAIHKLQSVYRSTILGTTFHIHPESVFRKEGESGKEAPLEEFTFLCYDCNKCCFPKGGK